MILVIFRRIWGALKPFYKKIVVDNIFAIAGQSAFFLILSAVPLLMFTVSVLQSLHLSTETLGDFLGDTYSSTQVSEWFKSLNNMYTAPTSISIITLIATLWSASKGLHAITNGLNRVHNTYESRTWLSLRLHAMLHTFVFLMIIAVTIGVMVFGKGLGNQIEPYLKKLPGYLVAIYSLRYIIVFLYQVFLFALLYRNTPNLTREKRKEYGFRCQLPGAVFCAASWHVQGTHTAGDCHDFSLLLHDLSNDRRGDQCPFSPRDRLVHLPHAAALYPQKKKESSHKTALIY